MLIKAIVDLLKIKSLLSLGVLYVFIALALQGKLEPKDVMVVVIMVFTSFFSYQYGKQVGAAQAETRKE